MAKFITLGCYTAKGLAGFVSNPGTDRKAATSALAASAGAKVTRYAGLRGKYDFMAEIDGTFEQAAAAAMVAVSSGAVSDFTILEDVDLNKIAETAAETLSEFAFPCIGISPKKSQCSITFSRIPLPSLPTTIAVFPE